MAKKDHWFIDIFSDNAFSMATLTARVNNIDSVPGRAGELGLHPVPKTPSLVF